MKYFKIILSFIALFFFGKTFSQQSDNFHFSVKNVDKIILSTVFFSDKESTPPRIIKSHEAKKDSVTGKWTLPHNEYEDVKDTIYIIKKVYLNKSEIKKMIELLKKPGKGHALLYHYDIQLDFYKKEKIIQTVTISSYTKNLVIKKNGCKTYIDENGQEIDPCFFQGMVSKELKNYIIYLLKKKNLWSKEQQFFEDL